MTSQSYILTLFDTNLDNGRWQAIHDAILQDGKTQYLASQLERCPTSGRLHWQAFVHFERQSKQRGTYFKKFSNKIHFEKCSALRAAAINYGSKEETRVEGPREDGEKPAPKALKDKADWDAIKGAILENKKDSVPFKVLLQYRLEQRWDGIRAFYTPDDRLPLPTFLPNPWSHILPSRRMAKKKHYWIFSREPNLGKTTQFAKPLCKNFRARLVVGDTTYYNISMEDECVVFDEYNSAILKYATLNSMCDGTYTYRRMYKSSIQLEDPLIIVLSNLSIRDLYPIKYELLEARFNEIELRQPMSP